MLPTIVPSSDPEGFGVIRVKGPLGGDVPLTGVLGDQQAATVGQVCFARRRGQEHLRHRQLHAAQHRRGAGALQGRPAHHRLLPVRRRSKPVYALEGSIAVTGSAVQWLRDQLGIISGASQSESLARQVDDNGGVYFVPAFSGLFAPYWRSDARGAIVGLSRFNTNAHLARATLEAICYQSRDVVEAMAKDSGVDLDVLKVDGGVTANTLCMQLQADILGVPVSKPVVAETTALGAAYAAGLAVGFWKDTDELRANWNEDERWEPTWDETKREEGYAGWKKAVERTLDWVDVAVTLRPAPSRTPARTQRAVARGPHARRSAEMEAAELDVLVVGGGVVGTGCALDAVTRGLRVGMVEARDWASGTSSRSSKLLHGGLRYLEMLDFALVKEALKERGLHLQRLAPAPGPAGAVPLPADRTAAGSGRTSAAGIALYDVMAMVGAGRARGMPVHKHLTRRRALREAPVPQEGQRSPARSSTTTGRSTTPATS